MLESKLNKHKFYISIQSLRPYDRFEFYHGGIYNPSLLLDKTQKTITWSHYLKIKKKIFNWKGRQIVEESKKLRGSHHGDKLPFVLPLVRFWPCSVTEPWLWRSKKVPTAKREQKPSVYGRKKPRKRRPYLPETGG